jgi:sec-independent protein translocase protein TatB
MFDIGFWELALIAILALVLLGPKRLPEAARAAGYWVGRARRFIASAKSELDQHMQEGDLDELRRLKQELDETRRYIHEVAGQTRDDFTRTMEEAEDLGHQIGGSLSDNSGKGIKKKTGKKKKAARSANKKRISAPAKKKASQKKVGKNTGKKTSKKTAKKSAKKKAGKKSPTRSRR